MCKGHADYQAPWILLFYRTLKDTQYSPIVRLHMAKCMETFLKVLGLLRHIKQGLAQWCEHSPATDLAPAQIPASGKRRCATSKSL